MSSKVAEEVAIQEFNRMCDANRIDHDESALDKKELREWRDLRGAIIQDIRRGALVVDDKGRPCYTADSGTTFTFHPATGATFMALETYGKGKNISNMIAAITEMTRAEKGALSKVGARDFQACLRLGKLFLSDR